MLCKKYRDLCIEFRLRTRLPLDEALLRLRRYIPGLSRATLGRIWKEAGVSMIEDLDKSRVSVYSRSPEARAYRKAYYLKVKEAKNLENEASEELVNYLFSLCS